MHDTVINKVVSNGFCCGCGVCAGVCPYKNLKMEFDVYGEYKPVRSSACPNGCHICIDCCPWSGNNNGAKDTIALSTFGQLSGIKHRAETGFFLQCYEGYSPKRELHRNGASGGLCTWLLEILLVSKIVDRIVCVRPTNFPGKLFEFCIIHDINKLRATQGSAYYPVEASSVLRKIISESARYAIVGLPCLLTALSLAENKFTKLKNKIRYKIGLVCGQSCSKKYLESSLKLLHTPEDELFAVKFRDKSIFPSRLKGIRVNLKGGGAVIGNSITESEYIVAGEAVPTACMFCDDIFAEVGDAVFMDGWLPPYTREHYGASMVIGRNPDIIGIFDNAIKEGVQTISQTDVCRIIASQRPRLFNKRVQLNYRLKIAKLWRIQFPHGRGLITERLKLIDRLKTIGRFYKQQVSHGVKIRWNQVPAAWACAFLNDSIIWTKKMARYVRYGKRNNIIVMKERIR